MIKHFIMQYWWSSQKEAEKLLPFAMEQFLWQEWGCDHFWKQHILSTNRSTLTQISKLLCVPWPASVPSITFSPESCVYMLNCPWNCFHVYFRGSSGPVLLLLHGGGHSALSWALFAVRELLGLTKWCIIHSSIGGSHKIGELSDCCYGYPGTW